MEANSLKIVENNIEYIFKNKKFLINAITHPSYQISDFQNLEFLGDRILGFSIASILYSKNLDIKNTAHKYANLVSTESLVKIAEKWNVESFLIHNIKNLSKKLLADAVEAIIAAVYLDSDYNIVFKFINNLYENILINYIDKLDFKTELQEFSLSKKLGTPHYELIKEEYKLDKKWYTMQVKIENAKSIGAGFSKQEATKQAAENLFKKLK